jgi:hypothetical protein
MSESSDAIERERQSNADSIAGDILDLLKSGLTIALLYAAIIPLTIQFENGEAISAIFDSNYTAMAILFYSGSMTTCVYGYAAARRLSYEDDEDSSIFFQQEIVELHYPTMILFGLVISVFLAVFGIVQGWYVAYQGLSGSIPIWIPISIIVGSVFYLFVGYGGGLLLIGLTTWVNSEVDEKMEIILDRWV